MVIFGEYKKAITLLKGIYGDLDIISWGEDFIKFISIDNIEKAYEQRVGKFTIIEPVLQFIQYGNYNKIIILTDGPLSGPIYSPHIDNIVVLNVYNNKYWVEESK